MFNEVFGYAHFLFTVNYVKEGITSIIFTIGLIPKIFEEKTEEEFKRSLKVGKKFICLYSKMNSNAFLTSKKLLNKKRLNTEYYFFV